jgi:hypothetical protein
MNIIILRDDQGTERVVDGYSLITDGVVHDDYPRFCDAYFSDARWNDTGERLSNSELDRLNNEKFAELYDCVMNGYEIRYDDDLYDA